MLLALSVGTALLGAHGLDVLVASSLTTPKFLSQNIAAVLTSLPAARDFIRPHLPNMTSDVNVYLAGGTHTLSETLKLEKEDSGQNGFRVNYRGASEEVIVTGGVQIVGWTQVAGTSYFQATAKQVPDTRQLYVNGDRRARASLPSQALGTITITGDGYDVTNAAVSTWANPEDIEFVYTGTVGVPGAPWTDSRCGVDKVVGTHIIMKQPCFTLGRTKEGGSQPITTPSSIENHLKLLSQPTQWYFDKRSSTFYYWPLPEEDMSKLQVIAATVDTLVHGASVSNVGISGLTFSYSTWLGPSSEVGFIEVQANAYLTSPNVVALAPGSVHFEAAQNMLIENCTFIHLGGQGLVLAAGSSFNKIIGNLFADISGTGLRVGDVLNTGAPDQYNLVFDNSVWDVCREFRGGVGIFGGYLAHSQFLNNEIANVPYTGLSLGWGWGGADQAFNNTVSYNNIHDTMGVLEDGGDIYVNGHTLGQCTLMGNWLWNYPAKTTGNLYLDNGSNGWKCSNNLVIYTSQTAFWLYLQTDSHDNVVTGNFHEPGREYDGPPSNVVKDNTAVSDQNWTKPCLDIMANAGPRPPYQRGLSHNLAFRRPAWASSEWSPAWAASMAVDGDPLTAWSADGKSKGAWLEVDLLAPFVIHQVQIDSRWDMYDADWSTNFEVWASNNADMSQGKTVLGQQGSSPAPDHGEWRLDVHDNDSYRYVAIVKNDGTDNLAFAELRVF